MTTSPIVSLPLRPVIGNVISVSQSNDIAVVFEDRVMVFNGDNLGFVQDPWLRRVRAKVEVPPVSLDAGPSEPRVPGLRGNSAYGVAWGGQSSDSSPCLTVDAVKGGETYVVSFESSEDPFVIDPKQTNDLLATIMQLWSYFYIIPVGQSTPGHLPDYYPSAHSLLDSSAKRCISSSKSGLQVLSVGPLVMVVDAKDASSIQPVTALETADQVTCVDIIDLPNGQYLVSAGCADGQMFFWLLPQRQISVDCPVICERVPVSRSSSISTIALHLNGDLGLMVYAILGNSFHACSLSIGDGSALRLRKVTQHASPEKLVGLVPVHSGCVIGSVTGDLILAEFRTDQSTFPTSTGFVSIGKVEGNLLGLAASPNQLFVYTVTYRFIDKMKRCELSRSMCLVRDEELSYRFVKSLATCDLSSLNDWYVVIQESIKHRLTQLHGQSESVDYAVVSGQHQTPPSLSEVCGLLEASFARCGLSYANGLSFQTLSKYQNDHRMISLCIVALRGLHEVYWRTVRERLTPFSSKVWTDFSEPEILEKRQLYGWVLSLFQSRDNQPVTASSSSVDGLHCGYCNLSGAVYLYAKRMIICSTGEHDIPVCSYTGQLMITGKAWKCCVCQSYFTTGTKNRICHVCLGAQLSCIEG